MKAYEFLPHTADLCILSRGASRKELFKNSMTALYEAMGPKCVKSQPVRRTLHVKSGSREDLLVDFYNELVSLADIEKEAYEELAFRTLEEKELRADLKGYLVSGYARNIKAATHHDLSIREVEGGFEAKVVLDV